MAQEGLTRLSDLKRAVNNAHYSEKWLEYGLKNQVWQNFGTQIPMPTKVGERIHIPGWNAPERIVYPTPLAEGTPPDPKKMSRYEKVADVEWYGNYLEHTDLLEILFEDANNLKDAENKHLGDMMIEEREMAAFAILNGGSNVVYTNGSARTSVTTPINIGSLHRAIRVLRNGLDGRPGKPVSKMLRSDGNFGTVDIEAAYIAIIAPDHEWDVRQLAGFSPTSAYGGGAASMISPFEFGKVDNVRFICTTYYEPYRDAGGAAAGQNVKSTTGTSADIYPVIIFAEDAYAMIPLTGQEGMKLIRKNLGDTGFDPLNQVATVGYKHPFCCVITHQERIVRLECAVTDVIGQ